MIGVAADDVTGANDIGIMLAKHNYRTVVYSDYAHLQREDLERLGVEACILNTESRHDAPGQAYAKVHEATEKLMSFGCSLFIKKTCSVFRGNVGAEFDAMADALGINFALLIAAFPQNGRQTLHGYHFVHRRLLSESEFADDPVNPMCDSNLARVVGQQSRRRVEIIHLEEVRAGREVLAARLAELRAAGGYALCDALDDRDLERLAEVAVQAPMIGGSSAIAAFLPLYLPEKLRGEPWRLQLPALKGILVVAGSATPQTRAQCAHLGASGCPAVTLDARRLLDPEERARAVSTAATALEGYLAQGCDALVRVMSGPAEVEATQELGRKLGLSEVETSRAVSDALAEVAERVVSSLDLRGLVVAGGDTSATVLRRLGITGNIVLEEIQPGLPSGLSLGAREMLLVLKSGSFGRPDFLAEAIRHLHLLQTRLVDDTIVAKRRRCE